MYRHKRSASALLRAAPRIARLSGNRIIAACAHMARKPSASALRAGNGEKSAASSGMGINKYMPLARRACALASISAARAFVIISWQRENSIKQAINMWRQYGKGVAKARAQRVAKLKAYSGGIEIGKHQTLSNK